MPGVAPSSSYDIRARHPDRDVFYRLYQERSRDIWKKEKGFADVIYGPTARERLDFFPARGAARPGPLLVFIHGGFWHSHDKSEFAFVGAPFVAAGISVALINYSLAPKASIGDMNMQIRRAIGWLIERAPHLNIDPHRVVVAGHSAGGHLAASALLSPNASRSGAPAGVIAVSGIFDLRPLVADPINAYIGMTEADANANSPLLQIRKCHVPIMIAVGAMETSAFLGQTLAFADGWRALNGGGEPTVVPDAHHYSIVLDFADPESALFAAVLGFVRKL